MASLDQSATEESYLARLASAIENELTILDENYRIPLIKYLKLKIQSIESLI